jgi:hypothetical protein
VLLQHPEAKKDPPYSITVSSIYMTEDSFFIRCRRETIGPLCRPETVVGARGPLDRRLVKGYTQPQCNLTALIQSNLAIMRAIIPAAKKDRGNWDPQFCAHSLEFIKKLCVRWSAISAI